MSRQVLLISILAFSVMVLSSCGRNGSEGVVPTDGPAANSSAIKTDAGGSAKPSGINTDYQVTRQTSSDRETKIDYPQVADLGDNAKQDRINQIIREEALKVIKSPGGGPGSEVAAEVTYELKYKGADLLSVVYTGYVNVEGAAHPTNWFSTTNISIPSGDKLSLGDLVRIDTQLAREYRKGKLVTLSIDEASPEFISAIRSEFNFFSDDNLVRYLSRKDTPFYLTKDSLGVSLDVPHAVGDHAEFEIDYRSIQGNIKSDNDAWRDILKGKS